MTMTSAQKFIAAVKRRGVIVRDPDRGGAVVNIKNVVVNVETGDRIEMGPEAVWVHMIRARRPGHRAGTVVLEILTDLADRCGVVLELLAEPLDYDVTKYARLDQWYRRHGFEGDGHGPLVRHPKTK